MNKAPNRSRVAVSIITAGLIGLLSLFLFVGTDIADAKGKGHSGTAGVQTATLSAPATAAVGQSFHISGTGYATNTQTWVLVETATSRGWISAGVDASGALSLDYTLWESGTATLTAYQSVAVANTNITITLS